MITAAELGFIDYLMRAYFFESGLMPQDLQDDIWENIFIALMMR